MSRHLIALYMDMNPAILSKQTNAWKPSTFEWLFIAQIKISSAAKGFQDGRCWYPLLCWFPDKMPLLVYSATMGGNHIFLKGYQNVWVYLEV